MSPTEPFDLQATVKLVADAFTAVLCTIGFQAAVHGLIVAAVICAVAMFCMQRRNRMGTPLLAVVRKISIFCVVLAIPGAISLVTTGKLPQVNQLELNSFGLIGFWALVTAHLCMEEMNFQFFGAD
jgi:hypothetical protein